jgi:ATP-dependent helicase HepA
MQDRCVYDFIPGQRCISEAELQMGLGTVLAVEPRAVTVVFMATGDTRIYARQSAPLSRVLFAPGDTVQSHDGRSLKVLSLREHGGLVCYIGRDDKGREFELEESDLDNFIQLSRPSERLLNGQIDADKWFELRYRTLQHLNRIAHDELYGLTGSRTSLIPHQLYIAHEVAGRYAPRVLLADEVGLGKTIEAGLILNQQLLTERARRVLIVVPETLVHQWLVEMLRRFNLHFRIFDQSRCESLDEEGADDEDEDQDEEDWLNPFLSEQLVLCSLGFLAHNPNRLQQCLDGDWDLLVVDEAHHLAWSPQLASPEYRLVEQLATKTRGVLLLTATPEQLGKAGHFARLRLLDPDRFTDFDAFVEQEKHYEPFARVVEHLLNDAALDTADRELVEATLAEGDNRELLDRLKPETDDVRARLDLVEHLLDRHGTGRVLFRNTRAAVKGFPQRQVLDYPLPLPDNYIDAIAQTDDLQALLCPETYAPQGPDWIAIDPRIRWLQDLLLQLKPAKVLVICAHAATALDIASTLKTRSGVNAAVFHEGLSIVERDRAAAFFAEFETGAQVLVCSEIGSEGRNFQFAHHLVLFDLPLNPDLLEQRIGRLDRIGQNETIRIHVPWIEHSAQQVMFNWYHHGLRALEHTCPAGSAVYEQLGGELVTALRQPATGIERLLWHTRELTDELTETMHRGRDRLLEYNSCRRHIADALRDTALEQDQHSQLAEYMEAVFDCFGVDTELHSEGCFIIHPTDHMQGSFPGLPQDGLTITYQRDTALAFENAQFLSWEHPLVLGSMDMALAGETGNAALTALAYKGVRPGSLLLECLYVLEAAPVESLQSSRYLPPTTLRFVIDEHGHNHQHKLTHLLIGRSCSPVDSDTAARIVYARKPQIKSMMQHADKTAREHTPTILHQAQQDAEDLLSKEINRLQALRLVNPSVREAEIEFYRQQLAALGRLIDSATPRLDAVRVIVAT